MTFRDPHRLNRREFMRQAACASLGLTGIVNTLASLRLTAASLATQSDLNDYKALVCVFLSGGNDANNMLIPAGTAADSALRADYEAGRGAVAIGSDTLNTLGVTPATNAFKKYHGDSVPPMGLHPSCSDMATMFNAGDLAFVCNVGTLAYPIPTRDDFINETVPVPPNLFSHSDQQLQWQSSLPDQPFQTGWGGRLADLLHAAYNSGTSKVSMSISLNGINSFQRGALPETALFAMNSSGLRAFSGYHSGDDLYAKAYEEGSTFQNPVYKNSREGSRLQAIETLIKLTSANLMENAYADRVHSTREVEEVIGAADVAVSTNGIDYDTLFANATTSLGDQLKTVAKLIAGRTALGNNRQIFFVRVGGYDTHKAILESHSDLMNELSTSLKAFRDALNASGDWDKVVTFSASDFSRTFSANGTDGDAGTDHAWAGHSVVMGGPVAGGNLYGHFPILKIGDQPGSIDSHNTRGRFIPSTSVDQFSAVLSRWMGADSNAMDTIFPNLARFDNPWSSSTANLDFIPEDSGGGLIVAGRNMAY